MSKTSFLITFFLFPSFFAMGQGTPSKESGGFGGLFNKLKDAVEDVTTDDDEKSEKKSESWFDKAKAIGTSTLEKGKEEFDDLVNSGEEASSQMQALLSYLDKKLAGREPAFTDAQIQEFTEEIIPLVEEANGRKFKSPPIVKATGNLEMIQILGNDLVPQYQKTFPDTPKAMVYLRAYLTAGLLAPGFLGKYGLTDEIAYVLPENFEAIMEVSEIDPELSEDLLKIVIAHELTHRLQDETIDLNQSILDTNSADENLAFQATFEGHAMYIESVVGKKLGLLEAAKAGEEIIRAPDVDDEKWLLDRVAIAEAIQWESVYLGGQKFVKHHAEKDGIEKIWEILETPPTRTSMIVRPESYATAVPKLREYEEVFGDTAKTIGLPKWGLNAEPMGDFLVQSILSAVPRSDRDSIVKDVRESVLIRLGNSDLKLAGGVDIVVFEFASEAGATKMLEAMESTNDRTLAEIEGSVMVDILSKKEKPYETEQGETGSILRYETKSMILGESKSTVVQVSSNNFVGQVFYSDVDLKKKKIDAFFHDAFEKLSRSH